MPQETLTHTKARSMSAIDSMTMSAPYPRVNLVVLTNQKAREKRSRYVDYRMRLPPELSANCVGRYGHRGITGTAPRVGNGDDWGISPNRGVRCCASCWWKLPKLRHAASRNGAVGTST